LFINGCIVCPFLPTLEVIVVETVTPVAGIITDVSNIEIYFGGDTTEHPLLSLPSLEDD
jgi:hypothetical protein